jgi:hypothetical protein
MRSALLVCDRAALLKHLRRRFAINWHGDHGASHWARVRNNGLMIAEATGAHDYDLKYLTGSPPICLEVTEIASNSCQFQSAAPTCGFIDNR